MNFYIHSSESMNVLEYIYEIVGDVVILILKLLDEIEGSLKRIWKKLFS